MMQGILPFISPYTRNSFLVQSRTRAEVMHLVDFEGFDGQPIYCSCEAFTKGKRRPCKHIKILYSQVKQIA